MSMSTVLTAETIEEANRELQAVTERVKALTAKVVETTGVSVPEPLEKAPAPPPAPIVLTNEERLEAENLALRVQLLGLERGRVHNEAVAHLRSLDGDIARLQAQVKNMQSKLTVAYGIDFTKQQIEQGTGKIIPVK
jgi:hypothetical protein